MLRSIVLLTSAVALTACSGDADWCPSDDVLDVIGQEPCEPNQEPDPEPSSWCPESPDQYVLVSDQDLLESCLSETRHCERRLSIDTDVYCEDTSDGVGPCAREGRIIVNCSNADTWEYLCWPFDPPFARIDNDHCDGVDNDCDGITDEDGDEPHELAIHIATAWNTMSPPEHDDDPATPDVDWPINVCGSSVNRRFDPIWINEIINYEAQDVLHNADGSGGPLTNPQCHGAWGVSFDCALTDEGVLPMCQYDTAPEDLNRFVPGTSCLERCAQGHEPNIRCSFPPDQPEGNNAR